MDTHWRRRGKSWGAESRLTRIRALNDDWHRSTVNIPHQPIVLRDCTPVGVAEIHDGADDQLILLYLVPITGRTWLQQHSIQRRHRICQRMPKNGVRVPAFAQHMQSWWITCGLANLLADVRQHIIIKHRGTHQIVQCVPAATTALLNFKISIFPLLFGNQHEFIL